MLPLLLAMPAHAATFADLAWLVGSWRGGTDGTVYEEIWHPPLGGAMMGSFRLAKGDAVRFYELMTLSETELRIKHFGPDLAAWEKKKEVKRFTVAEATPERVVFDDAGKRLVYTRSGTTLEVRLEEAERTLTFVFQRVE